MVNMFSASHWSDGQRGRDGGSQRRSPLDVIMSQIRRKRTSSDRKPLGRLLSWTSDRTGIPEDGETEGREERGHSSGGVSQQHGEKLSLNNGHVCENEHRTPERGRC